MATSSVLAWRTPSAEEPGGLQSMESQKVGHDRMTKHTHIWNYDGACECVTELMMRAHDEAQGPLEVKHCTILGLVGSNQFMLCPWARSFFFSFSFSFFFKIVSCPIPSCFRMTVTRTMPIAVCVNLSNSRHPHFDLYNGDNNDIFVSKINNGAHTKLPG